MKYDTFNISIEFEDYDKNVSFTAYPEWQNDGIGSYEYFGSAGYDYGINYVLVGDIEWDSTLYTDEENAQIQAQYSYIEQKIIKIFTNATEREED